MSSNGRVTIRDVYDEMGKLRHEIQENYVHKTEFQPVKSIVYGLATLIMMAVGSAIVATVIRAAAWIL